MKCVRPDNSQFTPSKRQFMINFAVDDFDAIRVRLRDKGVPVIDRQEDENSRFAGILDPDGMKIELRQPKRSQSLTGETAARSSRSRHSAGSSQRRRR